MRKVLHSILLITFISSSNILYAAETMVGQVNGMMCIKCQKMVTEALQKACPEATVKVSWPEGVAVSSFADKSNLNEEEYKQTIAGTGFEVVKVIKVEKIIEDPSVAVSLLAN
jgi:copper chaperone|tara:strand:+ start:255 stop:593 length:339 start_codon:yes stop_codon:yes gene_type:complete